MPSPTFPYRDELPAETVARAFAALGIESEHDTLCERETTAWRERPGLDDPDLVDLGGLPFVTIDNPDSRDLDQALHISREGEGFRVRYALADAAHYVRPDSALFEAALERGASYYTPLGTAPMLPRGLSEDLVSLEPGVARRALVFDMQLDEGARVLGTRVLRARVHSRAQLTYRGVQAFLDGAPRADEPIDDSQAESLRLLRRLGTRLAARARERGVVAFDRREAEISVTGSPPRFVARERERFDVEEWNAQLSLLCNTEGAALLAGLGEQSVTDEHGAATQAVYRVHDAPAPARLRELRRLLDDWVTLAGLDDVWRWQEGRSLAAYIDGLPDAPRESGRVRAVQRQVLVLQRASEFRAEPGRHHALAVDGYARFSSPMREVVGVFVHKELLEALRGTDDAKGTRLRDAVIASANAARQRQKALDKTLGLAVIADLLESDLEADPVPTRTGTVLGVRARRRGGHLYIALDDLALDLKVYAEDLERRHGTPYTFEALRAVPADPARPAFLLGDRVGVRAAGYDTTRERFMLDAVPREAAARRERRRARRG